MQTAAAEVSVSTSVRGSNAKTANVVAAASASTSCGGEQVQRMRRQQSL